MRFELSEERRMLAETAERYLGERYPIERRHRNAARPEGYDPALWREMAELGLVGALLPPEVGGLGGTGEDLALVFERLGHACVVEPFLATAVLGATPIRLLGGEGAAGLLEAVIAGELTLALAHGEPGSRYLPSHVVTAARREGERWRLSGAKAVVANGDSASLLVVSARLTGAAADEAGLALFLVEPKHARIRGYATIDGARAAEIRLEDAPATPLGTPGEAFPTIEETLARGSLALSAEALGLAEAAKEMTLDYLKTRRQFGQPLGRFQALQHRMVEMVIEIEQLRSAVMLAAARLGDDRVTRERLVSGAKTLAGRVGTRVAEEAIQLHGGIGMSWDNALPHFAKRLVAIEHMLGDADHHLGRFAALPG